MQHHIANSKTPQEYLPRQKVQNLSTKSKSLLIIIIKKKTKQVMWDQSAENLQSTNGQPSFTPENYFPFL